MADMLVKLYNSPIRTALKKIYQGAASKSKKHWRLTEAESLLSPGHENE